LQEQIIEKDLPFLKKITKINFKAALAKGRRNYVCKRRLFMQASDEEKDVFLPIPSLISDVQKVIDALAKGYDGMRESLNFKIDNNSWNSICCEVGNCAGYQCPYNKECYYINARKAWEDADIIVANHALFFTDLSCKISSGEAGILPNYGVALIDEAHTLENNAAHHLGIYLTKEDISSQLNRLFNPRSTWGVLRKYIKNSPELIDAVIASHDALEIFFKRYETLLFEKETSSYTFKNPKICPDNLSPILHQVVFHLESLAFSEEDISRRTELDSYVNKLKKYIADIQAFTDQLMPSTVYYAEMSSNKNVSLYAVPLNVSEILKQYLFTEGYPVILCSATLTVQNSFNYYMSRTGFMNGNTLKLDSPYDPNQAKILLPKRLPDPGEPDFTQALIYYIQRFVTFTKGRAFVLFTSYSIMEYCAQTLQPWFDKANIKLLVQGNDLTRSQMLKEFKQDISSVLFGTDSFWTGVDVPGEALSNVIITKLPFASPGNPVVEARSQLITQQGKSAFSDYMLPEAILKFRQGVGRLIRSRNDQGIVVRLDKRVYAKRYGKAFLDSLPYQYQWID
jgi:ATP-dependent DNA helicase DinG